MAKPVFSWENCGSESFAQSLEDAYCEVVHWRPNYFKIPQGKSGKSFTSELARLFKAYATGSALESVALKAATILPILALQKPSRSSKYKAHVTCLERRLPLWLDRNLSELLKEGRTIQSRLPKPPLSSKQKTPDPVARTFAKKMFQGKTKAVLELLGNQEKGGVLQLDDQVPSGPCGPKSVREILKEKHPSGQPADPESLVLDDAHPVHDIVFDVRVFNPHAPSNRNTNLTSCYRKHERLKKNAYEQRVREVEHASFTPLVFSATGGLGNEAKTF